MRRRHSALALLITGSACLMGAGLPAVNASAAGSPGSGLGQFNLSASAPAVQFRFEEPTYCKEAKLSSTGGCEGVLPAAFATLRNGPIGYALSSVVWPGTLAGNLGSLLIVAGNGSVPDEARTLNDPVRAEARNSTGDPTVTSEPVPGTKMVSTALDDRSLAEATVAKSQAPVGTFGNTYGKALTQLTGAKTAISTAHSEAKDINLGGVVRIGAVISDVKATSDGTKASASGRTTTSGVTIAGVPVTIDERGVTVQGNSVTAAAANAAVNAALTNAGMTIAVSPPAGKPDGGSVAYNAGSLVFLWKPQPGTTMTAVLGGANVSVASSPALNFNLPAITLPPFGTGTSTTPVTGGAVGPATPPSIGGLTAPVPQIPGGTPPQTAAVPVLASARRTLPGGLSPWLALLGLGGAGFVCAGLKRLPDKMLQATAQVCLLEKST